MLSVIVFSGIFSPTAKAQEWTYIGVDSQKIKNFSVYPSEWYIYDQGVPDDYRAVEISHGNISTIGLDRGVYVWANMYSKNNTSGETQFIAQVNWGYWNDSTCVYKGGVIPVEDDGRISERIFGNVSLFYQDAFSYSNFEQNYTDFNLLSITYWNETYNDYYARVNFSDNGILLSFEAFPVGNFALISQPSRLPPMFSFTTNDGFLDINSTNIKLKINTTDADNNNDEITDTDYLYRTFINSEWTDWLTIPPLIDYDLGSVSSGEYNITLEVKNMYGTTQEQITVHYTENIPPIETKDTIIPSESIFGYSAIIIIVVLFFSISVKLLRSFFTSKYCHYYPLF